jgi:hypothetical protein
MYPSRPLLKIQPYTPIHIENKFIGGLIKKLGNWLFGAATTRVKNFLKEHGDDKITSLEVGRTPVKGAIDKTINLLSGGKYQDAKDKEGYDKFFHTFIIVNGKYRLEKNQTFNIINYSKSEDEENETVKAPNKTINEFVQAGVDKMGEDDFFGDYTALEKNCQWFLKNLLNANGITSANKFIFQDVKSIKESVGDVTNVVADETTDLASGIDKLVSWISGGKLGLRRGGKVHSFHSGHRKKRLY